MIGKYLKNIGFMLKIGVIAGSVGMTAAPAVADGLTLKRVTERNRAAQFDRQRQLMDSRLASQYQQSRRLRPTGRQTVNVTTIELSPTISTKAYSGRQSAYIPHAQALARKYGIPEALFLRLVNQESRWNPKPVPYGCDRAGAADAGHGPALGVNPTDPIQNLGVSADDV